MPCSKKTYSAHLMGAEVPGILREDKSTEPLSPRDRPVARLSHLSLCLSTRRPPASGSSEAVAPGRSLITSSASAGWPLFTRVVRTTLQDGVGASPVALDLRVIHSPSSDAKPRLVAAISGVPRLLCDFS